MERVSGTIRAFSANGAQHTVGDGTFTYNISGRKREGIPNSRLYKEDLQNCFIRGTVKLHPDIKSTDLTELTDATIQLELPSGRLIVLSNASYTADPEIDGSEGNVPVEFTAGPDDGEEISLS